MAKSKKPAQGSKPKKTKTAAKQPPKSKAKPAKSKAKPSANGKAKGKGTKSGKSAKTVGAKKVAKPRKPKTALVALLGAGMPIPAAVATPAISKPLANSNVPAATNLKVEMTTDQVGFRYILTLTDVTMPPPPPPPPAPPPPPIIIPAPVDFNIAAPGASPFTFTIPGLNLVSGHSYRLRLWVNPGDGMTPPNNDSTTPFNCP